MPRPRLEFRLPSIPTWKHWPPERLLREREENTRSFSRGFQMRAFTDEERWFPSFRDCYSHGVVLGEIARRGWPVYAGVDLAGQKRPGNVIFVAALDPEKHLRYPLEILRGNWRSPEVARLLNELNQRYPTLRLIHVENNGYQQALIDWIQAVDSGPRGGMAYWYKIEPFTTGANKADPQLGLPSLEIEFKKRMWVVPRDEYAGHDPGCQCSWCVWDAEVRDYPHGQQTDTVMAMWFCREAMAKEGALNVGQAITAGMGDLNRR